MAPAHRPPHKAIARAEFLLANFPDPRYNLIGNNCEHIANCWYTRRVPGRGVDR